MKVVVCLRQGLDGELNPFDACAYEAALCLPDAEVTLLSMGPVGVRDLLLRLTRLGAKRAILLSDPAFAGADTLATAYTLSLAIEKLKPDLILCGRQTLIGDTAQTGPMLSVLVGATPIVNVLGITDVDASGITCKTRDADGVRAEFPALLTVERINVLRMPSIRSRLGEVEVWNAEALGADPARIGLGGSPTRVIETRENQSGRRRCRWIDRSQLEAVILEARERGEDRELLTNPDGQLLSRVLCVGEAPLAYARSVCAQPTVIPERDEDAILSRILQEDPDAVLWGSDAWSKTLSARIAARRGWGLCADCTALSTDGQELWMIRPALAGSVMARIRSLTRPAMATVRTTQGESADVLLAIGYGARDAIEPLQALATRLSADVVASRKLVDRGLMPYECQVGLTGRSVSPSVYLAVGISGAVHHIVGMQRSGTVIAVNPDRDAPIFDYADYGILCRAEEMFE